MQKKKRKKNHIDCGVVVTSLANSRSFSEFKEITLPISSQTVFLLTMKCLSASWPVSLSLFAACTSESVDIMILGELKWNQMM